MTCPCCGQERTPEISIDLDSNTAIIHGKPLKVCAKQAELLFVLIKESPRTVRNGRLMAALWGLGNEPNNPTNVLKTHISLLRKKLRPFNIEIKVTWNRGYALVDGDAAPMMVAAE